MKTKSKKSSRTSKRSTERKRTKTVVEKPLPIVVAVEEKRPVNEAREHLKELSQSVKKLVDEGMFPTINEAIIATCYRDEANTEFKGYEHWQKEGFQVQKGEKAYLLWGRPSKEKHEIKSEGNKQGEEKENDEYTFFPVAHVFSNAQVLGKEQTTLDELNNIREQAEDIENEIGR